MSWDFLIQCRKENNLTQEQLAEKFGVSARTVSRWETGSNIPDLSILVELADYELGKAKSVKSWKSCFCIDVPDQCRSDYHTAPIGSKPPCRRDIQSYLL